MSFFWTFLYLLCQVLTTLILARVVLSWFLPKPTNVVWKVLYQVTEPVLWPIRRVLPRTGMFDFSPLIAVIILQVISFLLP